MHRVIVNIGDRFERLVAIGVVDTGRILCRCDCGTEKVISKYQLANGHTRSCGCLRRDLVTAKNKTHGMCGTRTYRIWKSMLARCYQPSMSRFEHYGGRGIKVCARWHVFENFYADMGKVPGGMSIDRIDVNGNYDPQNCRWATAKQQARNTTANKRYTYQGKSLCVAEWSDRLGICRDTLLNRIKNGFTPQEAIAAGSARLKRTAITYNGRTRSVKDWASDIGVHPSTITDRLRKGWSIDRALTEGKYVCRHK